MTAPLIGVTTFHTASASDDYRYISITDSYITALANAGAVPVPISLQLSEDLLNELVSHLDGVLLTGGGDLAPERYQAQNHPLLENVDAERDRVELFIADRVLDRELPLLGICRGLQTMNVALGGTLYLDIQEEIPGSMKHDLFDDAPRTYLAHQVQVGEESLLSQIIGKPIFATNSGHHQAIRDLGKGIEATAYAEDGIIEAIELPHYPFGLAVQWHPEWLTHLPHHNAIIHSFVQAASGNNRK